MLSPLPSLLRRVQYGFISADVTVLRQPLQQPPEPSSPTAHGAVGVKACSQAAARRRPLQIAAMIFGSGAGSHAWGLPHTGTAVRASIDFASSGWPSQQSTQGQWSAGSITAKAYAEALW